MRLAWGPLWVRDTRGWLGNLLPIWGWRLGAWRLSISYCYISPQIGGRGGEVQSLMGSLHKTMSLMTLHTAASILSSEGNKMADSVSYNWSTPLGCVCPISTRSSIMSSCCMEAALNGVPSPLVSTRTHIQLRSSVLSPGIPSWAAKAVAVYILDIIGGKEGIYLAKMGMLWNWREIHWLLQLFCEITRF